MKDMSETVTSRTATDILGINTERIWVLVRCGKLKAYRRNGAHHLSFKREDVENFKAQQERLELVEPTGLSPRLKTSKDHVTGKDLGLKTIRGKLLTTRETACFLSVSERWVQSHMSDGTFPIRWYPIGERERMVDSADVDDWLKKIAVEAGTAPLPLRAARKIQKAEEGLRLVETERAAK